MTPHIKSLIKKYPNDQDLGRAIRDLQYEENTYVTPRSKTIKSSLEVINEAGVKPAIILTIEEQISHEFLQGLCVRNGLDEEYLFDMLHQELNYLKNKK